MDLGERIQKARKSKGLTQKQLAEKLEIAEITVRKYESNKREPKIEIMKKIAEALGVSVAELIGWNDTVADREKSGVSVDDLAYEFNIPIEKLNAWESGEEPVPLAFIEKYAIVAKMLDNEGKLQEFSENQRRIVNIFERLSPESQEKIIELALLYLNQQGYLE